MSGGPAFGGDICSVTRACGADGRLAFEVNCIPTRDGAAMRISAPVDLVVRSPESFDFKGQPYSLCKRIAY